jgi:hypothetical protein
LEKIYTEWENMRRQQNWVYVEGEGERRKEIVLGSRGYKELE